MLRLCTIGLISDNNIGKREKKVLAEIVLIDAYHIGKKLGVSLFRVLNSLIEEYEMAFNNTFEFNCSNSLYNESKEEKTYVYTELKDVDDIEQCYERAITYIDLTSKKIIENESKTVDNKDYDLFVNSESLTLPEKIRELKDMFLVIRADGKITISEHFILIAIAKIFKIANTDVLWNKFLVLSKQKLWQRNRLDNLLAYACFLERKNINVYDVEYIQQTKNNVNIKDSLSKEIISAISSGKERLVRSRDKMNKKSTHIAFWVFLISAVLVYFDSSYIVENKRFMHENEIHYDYLENSYISYAIRSVENNDSDTIPNKDYLKNHAVQNIIVNKDTKLGKVFNIGLIWVIFGTLILTFIFSLILFLFRFIKNRNNSFLSTIIGGAFYSIIGSLLLYCMYNYIPEPKFAVWYNSFLIAAMMISIEIMVLMREYYSSNKKQNGDIIQKQHSSSIIVVFVIAAIVVDICIGYIELPYPSGDSTIYGAFLRDKLASAMLLGCLSFFVGKFIETKNIQYQDDIQKMEKGIKNLNKS